jgi:DDE superfamily endonuclease
MVVPVGGGFDLADHLPGQLQQAPPAEDGIPPPSRWTLRAIRAAIPEVAAFSLSGIWRLLQRSGLRWRMGRAQQFSPDPTYGAKVARLLSCLREAAQAPGRVEVLFLDEMGFTRWPEPGHDWGPGAPSPAPRADRQGAPNRLWRIAGALNARTGQVTVRDNYIVGREQLGLFARQLDATYPDADRIVLVEDNWSIHQHPDVLAVIASLPRLEIVWLPTYAPWLNPIEKLWRKLRQEVLGQHRLAGDWDALLARVRAFFAQFAHGSADLLTSVGLRGEGLLAQAIHQP